MLSFILSVAYDAGDILLHYVRRPDLRVDWEGKDDLVTEADRASESFLMAADQNAWYALVPAAQR